MERIWDDLLDEQDKAVIVKAGYEAHGAASWKSRTFGKCPAVLIIDMQRLAVGSNVPILEAIAAERTAMGAVAWQAMRHIVPFVNTCREFELPIIYTRVIPHGRRPDEEAVQIVEALVPQAGDLVLDKNYSSAFYGTSLLTHLVQLGVDSLIIVGNSTSGCVRVTAIDARQMGFSPIVPQECTFDRIQASHKIALLDMWMKYAAVISAAETLDYVRSLS